jgi:branched-chain amino acid transport system ATP-binding protein
VLARCGLERHRHERAGNLPIGIARLVEIARALVGSPKVLLLDEPTSGLSARETDHMKDVLGQVARQHDTAVVLVEHDVSFVMDCADRVMVLDLGRVLEDGPPAAIQRSEAVRSAYLG